MDGFQYFSITANKKREAGMFLLHDSVFYWQVEITFFMCFCLSPIFLAPLCVM